MKITFCEKKTLDEAKKVLEAELGKLNIAVKSNTFDGLLLQLIETVDKSCENEGSPTNAKPQISKNATIKQLKDKITILGLEIDDLTRQLKAAQNMY